MVVQAIFTETLVRTVTYKVCTASSTPSADALQDCSEHAYIFTSRYDKGLCQNKG